MNPFRLFSKAAASTAGTLSLVCSASELPSRLQAIRLEPVFITGFVSPHLDLDQLARRLAPRNPFLQVGEERRAA